MLSLQGTIRGAFVIGGEELMIDDLCPGERQPDQPFPVVTDIWPPNAGVLRENDQWLQRWEEQPRVALTFNRFMDARQLREPEEWLRVFEIGEENEETTVRRLALSFMEDSTFPAPETAVYALDAQLDDPTVRYLVIARAENDNIVDRSDPAQMLDADFEGTELSSDQIEVVWPLEGDVLDNAFWAALVDTGARLPESGDGSAGGWFHSWFAITLQNQ